MAFHHSNFGHFGGALKRFADLNGMVPEDGDQPESFDYPHDEFVRDFDEDGEGYEGYAAGRWEEHVAEAVVLTVEAALALAGWRREQNDAGLPRPAVTSRDASGGHRRTGRRERESRMKYRITSKAAQEMGVFTGESPEHALAALFVDGGYNARVDDDGNLIFDSQETARLCGDVDDWYIEEVAEED